MDSMTRNPILPCLINRFIDYLHFTKRFGIVGASQLPVHYLLSVKSPYSPLQILTRRSHETLISIHQLLGRILTTMLGLHALCYLNFYILSGLLGAKLQQAYVLCGLFGILSLTTMGITALAPVRRRNYRVFHMVHVALATAIIPVLYFHVTYIRLYLFEIVVVHALNVLLRFLRTTTLSGEIKLVSGTSLVDISIPTLPSGEKGGNFASWQPGQHAYISLPSHPLLRTFRSNPFSVASVPSMDKRLRFVARILDGNTAKLARSPAPTQKLKIEGPYGAVFHAERMLHYDRVLFVAGGVGATFIVPLYRQLLADLSPGKGSQRRRNVSFLWTARSMADVTWALPEDDKEREGFVERLRVCVTQAIGDAQVSNSAAPDFGHEDEIPLTSREDGIELEEQKTLLADDGDERPEKSVTGSGLTVHAGRPDLARTVEQVFSHNGTERVAVLVCGPRGLSQRLRKEVGRFVRQGREVWFWEECFAL